MDSIDSQKLEIEKERLKIERRRLWFDSLSPVLIALLSAFIGGVFVTLIQGKSNLELEEKKFQSQLIIKAVETGDRKQAVSNLKFLLSAGLITDKNNSLSKLIPSETEASLVLPSNFVEQGVKSVREGDFDSAIAAYKKAIQQDPLNSQAYNLLGYAMLKKNELDLAVQYLTMSIRIDPQYV